MEPGHPGTVPRAGFGTLWAGRLLPLLIAAAAFVVFRPALNNDFVNWDDDLYLTGHDNYRGLDWQQIRWMFTTTHGGPYQPLGWLSWAIDHAWWGMNPRGYHLSNMLLHAANAAVFYLVALMVLRRALTPGASGTTLAVRLGACAAALLFAVHPLRVESVAWATERRDVLSGLFYLLSVLAYLRWCERRTGGDSGRASGNSGRVSGWPAGAFVWFGCALLSKGMSVTLPAVLLILDVYPLRRVRLGSGAGQGWLSGEGRRALAEKIPFFAASLAIGCVAIYGVRHTGPFGGGELLLFQRLVISCYGVCFYLLKTIWPVGLSPLYEYPTHLDQVLWPYLLSVAVLAVLCVWAYRWRSRWPGVAAAWVCYLVILAPVSGLLQAGPQVAADRYTYLATMSLAMLVGGGLCRLWGAAGRSKGRIALAGGSLAVAVALGVLTWSQTLVWRNSKALWEQALRVDGNSWNAKRNLGICLAQRNRLEEAIDLYGQALEANPNDDVGHYNLALALRQQGRLDEAVKHYAEVVRLRPDQAMAHNDLGSALLRAGRIGEAIEEYRAALRIDPKLALAQLNLGRALHRQGKPAEALPALRRALQMDPGSAAGHYALGRVLADAGRLEEAIAEGRQALRIEPGRADVRDWLEGVRAKQAGSSTP